jgi:hypothetical protein
MQQGSGTERGADGARRRAAAHTTECRIVLLTHWRAHSTERRRMPLLMTLLLPDLE